MTLEGASSPTATGRDETIATNEKPPPSSKLPTRTRRNPQNPGGLIPAKPSSQPKTTVSTPPPSRKPDVRKPKTRPAKDRRDFLGPAPKNWTVLAEPGRAFTALPQQLPYESLGNLDQTRVSFAAGPSTFLAAGTGSGVDIASYSLIDLRTGKKVGAAQGLKTQRGGGSAAAVHQAMSPDGRYLAFYNSSADVILVGDMLDRKAIAKFPYAENGAKLMFPTKDRLLAVDRRHNAPVMLWELPSGKLLKQFSIGDSKSGGVQMLACSPGGRFLAVTAGSGMPESIEFFDLNTGEKAGTLRPPPGSGRVRPKIRAFAFSPDGKEFAAFLWGVQYGPTTLRQAIAVWDVATGRLTDFLVQTDGLTTGEIIALSAEPLQWFPDQRGWLVHHNYIFERDGGAVIQRVAVHTGGVVVRRGSRILDDHRLLVCDKDSVTKVITVKRTRSEAGIK